MSSWVENCAWYARYDIDVFDWHRWIVELQQVLPLPIYDITRILDISAAFDMAMHARHWHGELYPSVNIPRGLRWHMAAVQVHTASQQQYLARALYSHCARYTTGVAVIKCPPTDHMGDTSVVPSEQFESLSSAAHASTEKLRRRLYAWLCNVLQHGSTRSTTMCVPYRSTESRSGRRRHRQASKEHLTLDHMQAAVNSALQCISSHHHSLPIMWCTVNAAAGTKASIALYAHRRALCDE